MAEEISGAEQLREKGFTPLSEVVEHTAQDPETSMETTFARSRLMFTAFNRVFGVNPAVLIEHQTTTPTPEGRIDFTTAHVDISSNPELEAREDLKRINSFDFKTNSNLNVFLMNHSLKDGLHFFYGVRETKDDENYELDTLVYLDSRITNFLESKDPNILAMLKDMVILGDHGYLSHNIFSLRSRTPEERQFKDLVNPIKRSGGVDLETMFGIMNAMTWEEIYKENPKVKDSVIDKLHIFVDKVKTEVVSQHYSEEVFKEFTPKIVEKYLIQTYLSFLGKIMPTDLPEIHELMREYDIPPNKYNDLVHSQRLITIADPDTGVIKKMDVIEVVRKYAEIIDPTSLQESLPIPIQNDGNFQLRDAVKVADDLLKK